MKEHQNTLSIEAKVCCLRLEGKKYREISKSTGLSNNRIFRILKEKNLTKTYATKAKKAKVFRLYVNGVPPKKIALETGIPLESVEAFFYGGMPKQKVEERVLH